MATSGSYDYSVTAAQIITAALEDIGVIAAGETVATADMTTALVRLNFIAKQFQGKADMAQGLKVWTRQRITMFLAKNQAVYTIGPAAGDSNATTQYGRTTISAFEAIGQTTLSITSITDTTTYPGTTVTMTMNDNIGIVQNDGTIFWTTIASTGAGPMVVVNAAITVAANAGNYVYWYTTKAQRFPEAEIVMLRNSDIIDTELGMFVEAKDYEALPQKGGQGDPINVLIEPLRLNTRVTLDYFPQDVTKQLRITAFYPSEDYDSSANDIAFPQEWFAALEWELAFRLAPSYGATWTPAMQSNYDRALTIARELNPQNSSAYFKPGDDGFVNNGSQWN